MTLELFPAWPARAARARNDHIVAGSEVRRVCWRNILAQGALDAVAADGMRVDLARHGQSEPGGHVAGMPMHGQPRRGLAAALFEDAIEIRARAHPRSAREAGGHRSHAAAAVASVDKSARTKPARTGRSGLRSGAKTLAALGATTREDLAAIGRRHAGTEAVVALALEVAGLVGALGGHGRLGVNGGKDRGF
jgi:hypothetical protein